MATKKTTKTKKTKKTTNTKEDVKAKKSKPAEAGSFKIMKVEKSAKAYTIYLSGVRLVLDNISNVKISEFQGAEQFNFCAGIELPDCKEVRALKDDVYNFFKKIDGHPDGWFVMAGKQFLDKKFQKSKYNGNLTLFPTSPAKENPDGSYSPKGTFFVSPSPDKFYSGCFVEVMIAFVVSSPNDSTFYIKDYLNGIRFVKDGERIAGISDPFGNSASSFSVGGTRQAHDDEPKKKGVAGIMQKTGFFN